MAAINPIGQKPQQPPQAVEDDDMNPPGTPKVKELSPDDFIKLFLTQLQHQNPMEPTDSSKMLSQMADISSINSSKSMQKTMKQLAKHVDISLGNSQVLEASQLIGKQVQMLSGQAHMVVSGVDEHKVGKLSGSALLQSPATNVKVSITDSSGKTVMTKNLGPCTSAKGGLMDFEWDGKNDKGELQPDGFYGISASAEIDGKTVKLRTAGAFDVKSVAANPENGKLIINVDGLGGRGLSEILKIM